MVDGAGVNERDWPPTPHSEVDERATCLESQRCYIEISIVYMMCTDECVYTYILYTKARVQAGGLGLQIFLKNIVFLYIQS